MRLLPLIAAACLLLAARPGQAEPLTLDRLLRIEDFGTTAVSPGGRYAVIETLAPYASAARFDFETPAASLGRLRLVDLAKPGPSRPLLEAEPGAGYIAGPFSPSGYSMVVFRWKDRLWDTGVVELATGAVRWLGIPTEQALYGRTLTWRDEKRLVLIALPDGGAPLHLRLGWQNQARLPELWARQAMGAAPSLIVQASGASRATAPLQDRRLIEFDLSTGARRVLAAGGFFDLEPSPDGRQLAVLGDAEPIGLAPTERVRQGAPGRRRDLTLINLVSGTVRRPCPDQDLLTHLLAWSPTGDRLLVFGRRPGRSDGEGRLLVIDAVSGVASPVGGAITPHIDYGGEGIGVVRADWLGATPIVYGRSADAVRPDWHALEGGGPRNLTAGLPDAAPGLAAITPRSLLLVVGARAWRVDRAGHATVLAADPDLRAFRPSRFAQGARLAVNNAPRQDWLWLETGHSLVRLGPRGRASWSTVGAERVLDVVGPDVLVETRSAHGVRVIARVRPGATAQALLVINQALENVDDAPPRLIETHGSDGRRLKSWLYLPPTAPGAGPPPLIVVPYPGSTPSRPPRLFLPGAPTFTPSSALLTAQGYAVLYPALPTDRALGEPVQGLAQQVLAIVDAAAAQGLVDPDRLSIWGHSHGGYAALAIATQTNRFKAIIAQAAKADLVAGWGAVQPHFRTAPQDGAPNPLAMGHAETGQGAMRGPPWSDAERYRRNSPLMSADRITAPVLLIAGDQDFVALSQSEAMFAALYRQDKDARLLTLFGEGHLPTSPANIRAIYDEVLPWLAQRLEPPSAAR